MVFLEQVVEEVVLLFFQVFIIFQDGYRRKGDLEVEVFLEIKDGFFLFELFCILFYRVLGFLILILFEFLGFVFMDFECEELFVVSLMVVKFDNLLGKVCVREVVLDGLL